MVRRGNRRTPHAGKYQGPGEQRGLRSADGAECRRRTSAPGQATAMKCSAELHRSRSIIYDKGRESACGKLSVAAKLFRGRNGNRVRVSRGKNSRVKIPA